MISVRLGIMETHFTNAFHALVQQSGITTQSLVFCLQTLKNFSVFADQDTQESVTGENCAINNDKQISNRFDSNQGATMDFMATLGKRGVIVVLVAAMSMEVLVTNVMK